MPVPDGPLLPLTEGRSFSSIQHLGAEIHLIRDMMDPIHTGGLYDFLLTALEVRDRNAPVAGQTPSLPQPPPWGWAHSHSRLACLRGRGVLTEPLSLPLLKEAVVGWPQCASVLGTPRLRCVPGCVPKHRGEGRLYSPADWGHGGRMSRTHGGPGPGGGQPWCRAPEPVPMASAPPLSRQSCYEHIQKEDMHRLPSRWDSREPR